MPRPKDWILFAEDDLLAAKTLLEAEVALTAVFYHSQQSAEKILKAYLLFKEQPILKTHDLVGLLEICEEFDQEFNMLTSSVYDLNPFSSKTRYPDDFFVMPSIDTAKICIKKAEKIIQFVKNKIE